MPSSSPAAARAPVDLDGVPRDAARSATLTTAQADDAPPPGRRAPVRGTCGLAFDTAGGPIVVVCGLHGGAGTSSLAHALAATAALESRAPVLLCESDDVCGDVAQLTHTTSPLSLGALAAAYAAGAPPDGGTLARAGELRVIAGPPAPAADAPDGALAAVVRAASAHHGLTVLDAGTLRARSSRELLQAATHVVWTTIAQPGRGEAARALLCSELVPKLAATQILAVRSAGRGRDRGVRQAARELRELAEEHCDRVILIADRGGVIDHERDGVRATLTALAGALTCAPGTRS
jgi:hypothetical protein